MHHQTLHRITCYHTSNGCMTSLTNHTAHGPLLLIEQISPHDQILNNDVLLLFSRCTLFRNSSSRCCTTFLIHCRRRAHGLCRCVCFVLLLQKAFCFFSLKSWSVNLGGKSPLLSGGKETYCNSIGRVYDGFLLLLWCNWYQSRAPLRLMRRKVTPFFTGSLATLSLEGESAASQNDLILVPWPFLMTVVSCWGTFLWQQSTTLASGAPLVKLQAETTGQKFRHSSPTEKNTQKTRSATRPTNITAKSHQQAE